MGKVAGAVSWTTVGLVGAGVATAVAGGIAAAGGGGGGGGGAVKASGLTIAELREEIHRRLAADYMVDPQVSVSVKEYHGREVTVMGAVRTPGVYTLRRNAVTLLDALARAGGLDDGAGRTIWVTRGEQFDGLEESDDVTSTDGTEADEAIPPPDEPAETPTPPDEPDPGPPTTNEPDGAPTLCGEPGDGPGLPDEPDEALTAFGESDDAPAALPFDLTGFFDVRGGLRTQPDTREKDSTLGESRLQLQLEKVLEDLTFRLTTDFLYDISANDYRVFMEQGRGLVDLREAWVAFRPTDFMDVKVGRQVLTWGTGDLRFLNDLFPKDWNAFFIGRDVEYLKAPSDALKVSLFSDLANLDLVYTPRFDADRYVDGRRISYYNPFLARRAGRDAVIDADEPEAWFKDDEFAARLYKTVNGYELALYTYNGFWKSPAGTDPVTFTPVFPRLAAYGASVRGPAAGGIGNVEAAYYDSREDRSGNDPLVPNSQVRLLVGYERDLAAISKDLTVGVQYYLELRMGHEAMERMRPAIFPDSNRERHEVTLRLTKLLLNQNLTLSLFVFYSPTDEDAYLRPRVAYKVDDHWTVEAGANVLFGNHAHTFFGQFEDNSNVYFGARYSF